MGIVTMKELLEAGVHFGHQSKRWNPKMRPYIYSSRNDIHVIDLHKTIPLIEQAYEFVKNQVIENGTVLFVGTKKQAQEAVAEDAKRCGMFFINERWLGGTLTNFKTIKKNIARLNEIEKQKEEGFFEKLPKKEVANLEREHRKLIRGLAGIRSMTALPSAVFIVDTKKEQTALKEAKKLGIPVVAIVDTNSDPDEVDFPMPGNDDAIRSIKLLTSIVAEAVLAGREVTKPAGEIPGGAIAPEPIEITDEVKSLTEEERIEESGVVEIKKEPDEKRTGF